MFNIRGNVKDFLFWTLVPQGQCHFLTVETIVEFL
jgi:hypothetical protein